KDYWIMHAIYGLKELGLKFELKGGTSLSKGFGIIHRFSEDIDIRIEPFDGIDVKFGPNYDKPDHIESRKEFFDKLRNKIEIPGITSVERDHEFDDKDLLRNAGLRLKYDSHFGAVSGMKDGILLEVGSDKTDPHQQVTISSWVVDFAKDKLAFKDNRAPAIDCYNPEYTFVEKLQTVVKKFRQFREKGQVARNFLRHYYDIHQLLDYPAVQIFIGTPEYLEHKKKRFKSENQKLRETGAFTLDDTETRKLFESEYAKTAALYYRGQVPLDAILARIQKDL